MSPHFGPETDEYVELAMRRAEIETLEDGSLYAEIQGFEGVWAEGEDVPSVREELREVLSEWLGFRLSRNLVVPKVGGSRRAAFED